jgi:hypothetical protein
MLSNVMLSVLAPIIILLFRLLLHKVLCYKEPDVLIFFLGADEGVKIWHGLGVDDINFFSSSLMLLPES